MMGTGFTDDWVCISANHKPLERPLLVLQAPTWVDARECAQSVLACIDQTTVRMVRLSCYVDTSDAVPYETCRCVRYEDWKAGT